MAMKEQEWMMAWVSLVHAGTFLSNSLGRTLRDELGIGLAEQDLIKQIAINDDALTMSQLANRLYYSKAGITKMVDRLTTLDLLERKPSETDRRVIRIGLTAKGRKAFRDSRTILKRFVSHNFRAHLSDRQISDLGNALETLLSGLGRYDGQLQHLKGKPSGD